VLKENAMTDVIYINGENFQQDVLEADLPVLIDFTAAWCGPCKMLAPLVEELAEEWQGKVRVYKMDVDANPEIPVKLSVLGVPSLILFKNGKEATRITGFKPKKYLQATIEAYL
jgi:thioredoxin 1